MWNYQSIRHAVYLGKLEEDGPRISPIFLKKPYWCTANGVMDDEMSQVRPRQDKGVGDKAKRLQHDYADEVLSEMRQEVQDFGVCVDEG